VAIVPGEEHEGEESKSPVRRDEEPRLPGYRGLNLRREELRLETGSYGLAVAGAQLLSGRVRGLTAEDFPETAHIVVNGRSGAKVEADRLLTVAAAEDEDSIVGGQDRARAWRDRWQITLVPEKVNKSGIHRDHSAHL
jgi:hypothetical protein